MVGIGEEPNEIFGSQAQKKEAKTEKFGAERAKLATLRLSASNIQKYIY